MSNRDPIGKFLYVASIGDVIDDVTWLWRYTRESWRHSIQSRRIWKL